ncbi:conserved hypothetical protein [Talaromyces stipitatus ATCC 10500]|uniref:ATP-dependent DNA helicase n=1 Tax=Talaromyces stipitatus (strain ATCC 10500 / CBS 375.48 / QM 6759 / NRRL 1006) TaxID=441959 RepID=B8MJ75_TALSN|nr:uncharacterized protein TSTA_041420 [Talaromyces stipitatus ATCC 10500]EED14664.1 conserved hypothetical protein [Talaromyces stipitatus ATCC 10500]
MAEPRQVCSSCRVEKPLHQFKSKTGNRTLKTCSACCDRVQGHRIAKRKSNEADVSEPPVEETHVPHFMRPTTASLRRLAPQRVPAQQLQQQIIENSQQVSSSSPTPSYHHRGVNSQDTPRHAEARRRQAQDQRAHRAARRAGEDVQPTQDLEAYIANQQEQDIPQSTQQPLPSTPQASQYPSTPDPLMAINTNVFSTPDPLVFVSNPPDSPALRRIASGVSATSSTPDPLAMDVSGRSTPFLGRISSFALLPYRGRSRRPSSLQSTPRRPLMSNHFVCNTCQTPRHLSRRIANGLDICEYCQDSSIPFEDQYKFCVSCQRDIPITAFFDDKSYEHAHCNPCRASSVTQAETDPSYAEERPEQDPPYVPGDPDALLQSALTETDWEYVTNFHQSLNHQQLEFCQRCCERWFNLRLNSQGICDRCIRVDKSKDIHLFSAANNLHIGQMPDLPELSQTEEMLIARVHVSVQYSGHVVNFLRDTARVYDTLPLIPQNLEVILLCPANTDADPRLQRQFINDFRVRRECITKWLAFLRSNHPGYRDITISQQAIDFLPRDSSVANDIFSQSIDPVEIDLKDVSDEVEIPEHCAVPDLIAQEDEITAIREQLQPQFNEYVKHLMRFDDYRFARHPRLRYVVFNTMMRQQANTKAGFFVKQRTAGGQEITAEQLRAAFEEDTPEGDALINSISRRSGTLRGTRPFWTNKHQQLKAMVHNLGPAHLFLTLSAADLHWDDLMKLMPRYQEWQQGTSSERIKISRENLRENPHIVANWFHIRFAAFRKELLDKKFKVKDYWYRYEWQGRGSVHVHSLYWLEDAPKSEIAQLSEPFRQAFTDFWSARISALNPQPGVMVNVGNERSPLQLAFADQRNTVQYLSQISNSVQRHTRSNSYCLRKEKGSNQVSCRFHFPHSIRNDAAVEIAPGHHFYCFYPVRNDPMMNSWNRCILMAWLANIDIAPCTGTEALLEYIAKYATKAEKKTESYSDLMKSFLPRLNEKNPFLSAVSKMMNHLIGERDWSAQEVLHLLLDLPLQASSRITITMDCRPETEQPANFANTEDADDRETLRRSLSPLDKYKKRPSIFDHVTYFTFLRTYDFGSVKNMYERSTAEKRVINYFPIYDSEKQPGDYARVKLMLHHPFRVMQDLLTIDNNSFGSYAEAYEYCKSACSHENDFYGEKLIQPDPTHEDSDDETDNEIPGSWEALARQLPHRDDATRLEDPDLLGDRTIDREMDWSSHIGSHSYIHTDFWATMKEEFPHPPTVRSSASPEDLEVQQRHLYDLVINHYEQDLTGQAPSQLLINLDGRAGTGKSHVIMLITTTLDRMARNADINTSPVMRAAPTGVAAYNINGRTLHSLFRLPIARGRMADLTPENLQAMQANLRNVKWLIIDEKSMIGLKQLYWVNLRLQQIFPTPESESARPFGGLNVILAGDFYQLPPVGQRPLYFNKKLDTMEEIHGHSLYLKFDVTVELDVIRRQDDTDQDATSFRQALENLREDNLQLADWKLLCTRVKATVSPNEIDTFKDVLLIYSKKVQVHEFNHNRLRDIGNPVLRIMATHQGLNAEKASTDDAGNLHAEIHLSIGCRIMLLENIWTDYGLVNGAFGTVLDIVWEAGTTNPRQTPPFALLVHFDSYNGPACSLVDNTPVVPIFRSKRDFMISNINCSRTQFPITVAYAMTVHKAQGITIGRAVLNITDPDFQLGLTYVALSRVKRLSGLLFEESFDYDRFVRKKPHPTMVMRKEDGHRRLEQHIDYVPLPGPLPSQPSQLFQAFLPIRTSSPLRGSSMAPHVSSQTPPGDEILEDNIA